jgi:A/G-specific adenine glycosylase
MRATKNVVVETGVVSSPANGKKSAKRIESARQNTSRKITGIVGTTGAKNSPAFRRALLTWYDEHRRDLPWRKTRDPYAIWISEIMLQQTRVAAVLDHYRIFLERFPNVEALATATEDSVLAIWSGLGYYRRARMMHRCAKELVENHDGRFPETAEALQDLPGIGRYTAAAIASIAFGEPIAVVDGNVERVLQRLAATTLTTAQMWIEAQDMLSIARPADFNQAMMELGAIICIPGEPRCESCPVRKFCAFPSVERWAIPAGQNRTRLHNVRPSRQTKKEIWCLLIQKRNQVRLVQRSEKDSLMPGMWELPHLTAAPIRSPASEHWRTFRHSITVTNYTVHVLRDGRMPVLASPLKSKWIAVATIPQIPITGLTRKILKADGII